MAYGQDYSGKDSTVGKEDGVDEDDVGFVVSDDDQDSIGLSKKHTIVYTPNTSSPILCLDMAFENFKQVTRVVDKCTIFKGVVLSYYHNDKDRLR